MKTLMILGALEEFVPLVALAKQEQIKTVVVDGNENAPAKAIADCAYTVDVRRIDDIAAIAKREKVDAITTAYSDLLLECMVKIAQKAGLPCHLTPKQLPYYRDKHVINQTCEELHIPTPKSVILKQDFSAGELSDLSFPMVIKPLDLYGSRGLFIVHSEQEIRQHFSQSCQGSNTASVLAEEYNPDHEFNIQCWVHDGKVHVLGIADREKTSFDPTTVPLSTRNIYPSCLIDFVYENARQVLTEYIRFTKQTQGPLCMQFYWGRKRGLEVGEIAARFLGYEHELIAFSSGLRIEELLLTNAVRPDQVPTLLKTCNPFGNRSAAVVYFHAKDGIVADLSKTSEAAKRPDVTYSQIFYQAGDRIGSPQTQPYAARFDLVDESRKRLDRSCASLVETVSMTDATGNELLLKGIQSTYEEIEESL